MILADLALYTSSTSISFSPILGADLLCLSSSLVFIFSSSLESYSSNSWELSELALCLLNTGYSTGNGMATGGLGATGATGAAGVVVIGGGIGAAGVEAMGFLWLLMFLGEVKGGEPSVFKAETVC